MLRIVQFLRASNVGVLFAEQRVKSSSLLLTRLLMVAGAGTLAIRCYLLLPLRLVSRIRHHDDHCQIVQWAKRQRVKSTVVEFKRQLKSLSNQMHIQ